MRSVYGCIYGIWNPDRTKAYVGQTTKTPAERWAGHVRFARAHKGCPKLGAAIRKHGDQMIVEPLDVAECQEDLDFLEMFYICALDAIKQGYNCAAGGNGVHLLDEGAKERHRANTKTAMNHPEVKRRWKTAIVRLGKTRMSGSIKIGQSKMTSGATIAWHANMSASAKARWARQETAGRVLLPPEKREYRRLYTREYRARRKAGQQLCLDVQWGPC